MWTDLAAARISSSLLTIEEIGENFETGFIGVLGVIQENIASVEQEYTTAQKKNQKQ